MTMIRPLFAFAAGCATLAACTAQPPESGATPAAATPTAPSEPAPPAMPAIVPAPAPSATGTPPATDTADSCGASKMGPWIGKEATVPVRLAVVRAAGAKRDRWLYPDSVVTMDFDEARLNVMMDKGTDRIVSARCG